MENIKKNIDIRYTYIDLQKTGEEFKFMHPPSIRTNSRVFQDTLYFLNIGSILKGKAKLD